MTTTLPTPAPQRDTAAPTTPAPTLGALWSELVARRGHTNSPHRLYPSLVQIAVMAALLRDGQSWAGRLAADTGRDQGNLLRHTLPTLDQLGVIERGPEERLPHGGRPAHMWHLTATGRALAALLPTLDELDEVA